MTDLRNLSEKQLFAEIGTRAVGTEKHIKAMDELNRRRGAKPYRLSVASFTISVAALIVAGAALWLSWPAPD